MLWAVRPIDESSETLLNKLEKKAWYLPFLKQLATETRKQEWLSVRVLLKELLNEEKEIIYLSSGRPVLADGSYHLSVSHTKGFVAVALHPRQAVGVDIEYRSPRIKKIRSKFLNEAEERNLCLEQEEAHLLLHWSAKESLFKALGEENVDFREHLCVHSFLPVSDSLSSFTASETRTPFRHTLSVEYLVTEDYVLTAVSFKQ